MSDPRPDADIELAALRKEHRRTWARAVKTYRGLKPYPDELAMILQARVERLNAYWNA